MYYSLVLLWVPVIAVVAIEHFALTRVYKKPSTLQQLFAAGKSARIDLISFVLFYIILPQVHTIAALITLPGAAYLTLTWLTGQVQWSGLLSAWMPQNPSLLFFIWLLAIDFAVYLSHMLMHHVPWLWTFHKLHHSATEANILTGSRISIGENFLNEIAIVVIVTIVLGLPSPEIILAVMFIRRFVDLLQHSNLPWDYGVLGYVIASPRFHRLHHSSDTADFNAHYGNIFSFWDYLFGTAASHYTWSPQIADKRPLGLADKMETKRINDNWRLAPFQATGLDYAWIWLSGIAAQTRWAIGNNSSVAKARKSRPQRRAVRVR